MINDVDLKKPKYNGLRDVMKQSWEAEGLAGLWKGINVNIMRSFLINAGELSAYDTCKIGLVNYFGMDDNSTLLHFISSATAGFCGALLCQPADVIKSRFMNQQKDVK